MYFIILSYYILLTLISSTNIKNLNHAEKNIVNMKFSFNNKWCVSQSEHARDHRCTTVNIERKQCYISIMFIQLL